MILGLMRIPWLFSGMAFFLTFFIIWIVLGRRDELYIHTVPLLSALKHVLLYKIYISKTYFGFLSYLILLLLILGLFVSSSNAWNLGARDSKLELSCSTNIKQKSNNIHFLMWRQKKTTNFCQHQFLRRPFSSSLPLFIVSLKLDYWWSI